MGERVEEYRRPDCTWSQSRRSDVILYPSTRLIRLVSDVDPETPWIYYLGTAQHETNLATNERDTEPNGFQSWGLYQISLAEAASVGLPGVDLLDPVQATQVMARLTHRRRDRLRLAAKLAVSDADPPDLWSYVAIAHNQGEAAAVKTIERFGMNWMEYKRRNRRLNIVSSGYGDDVQPHLMAS